MEELIKSFKFATTTYSNNTLCIIGPSDQYGFQTFVSAYRSYLWNEIPKTTKIMFKYMMVEYNDDRYGGDKWCMKWLIDYFGDNFSCENCYYVYFEGEKNVGKFIVTNPIDLKDFV